MTETFSSQAEVVVDAPAELAATFAEFWTGYDVEVAVFDGRVSAKLGIGEGVLEPGEGVLNATVTAADRGALEMLRSYFVQTVRQFLGEDAQIAWRGDMETGRTFADFREVRLVSSVEIAPRLRRLTFTGEDIARFGSETDIHVRLYFPPEGVEVPEWPRPGPDGGTIWPAEGKRPDVRYYTVRRWLPERQAVEVDFVLHADEGPGCRFAVRAAPGTICGMAGPVGRTAPKAGWTLLAGDETALPAISRILETMPRNARGVAFIEVDRHSDQIPLDAPQGVAVRWLHRRGAPAGAVDLLYQSVVSAPMPLEADPFAWVACEFTAAKAIRKHLRTKAGLPRDRQLVVGYWQRDCADEVAA